MALTTERAVQREKLGAYQAARRKGADWLLQQCNADGSLGDPGEGFHFYRAPWTFTLTGDSAAASAVCGWFRRHMLLPDGRIGGPYRVFDDAYAYRNSALIVGAQMAQQYDLSHGLMPELLAWQDPISGGFPNDRTPAGGKGDTMDIPYACGPGFACLATGHLDVARHVYRFLATIYAAQTELPMRFYYAWSCAHQAPIREYAASDRFWYVVENQEARLQRWTIGGIAAGFLCRLYLTEPRPEYLTLARQYQDFSMGATDRQFDFAPVCKSGWGSALLYQLTGELPYLNWTYRMGDWFVATQAPAGYWQFDPADTRGRVIHDTFEFVMHLDTLIGGLTSRPTPGDTGT
jgi:hypothetical protein